MGYVEGEEFSPTHFRSRRFSFYEIPIIHWQITPIKRTRSTPATARLLSQKKWISPPSTPPSVWHLVSLRRGAGERFDDDAALLLSQLRLRRTSGLFWSQWSQKHPQLARVLWPTIATLAQRELYILMPRLLELVRPIDDVDALRATQDHYLRQEYASLIDDMRAAGRDDLADALMAEAAQDRRQTATNLPSEP
ncbi:hypothetical protein CA85_37460 [Allorhodopirellula solitaria]|uniref:Uncharacterized protein n=2 Tax=Allorhodopirellula solitaria TaxID=2527987 RepID=A0A5C5XQD1_9BACT|nr:hypothetical protein CA85_37460 [Allorhodopirellula solitaria]